jgi:hypothetical protein
MELVMPMVYFRRVFHTLSNTFERTLKRYANSADMPTFPLLAEFSRFLCRFPPSRAGFMKSRFYRCCVMLLIEQTTIQLGIYHLSLNMRHQWSSGQLSVNCYMHGEAVLSGEPMTADLQHLNSL